MRGIFRGAAAAQRYAIEAFERAFEQSVGDQAHGGIHSAPALYTCKVHASQWTRFVLRRILPCSTNKNKSAQNRSGKLQIKEGGGGVCRTGIDQSQAKNASI